MLDPDLLIRLPVVRSWIEQILIQHKAQAQPVSSFGFLRLPQYFSSEHLAKTSVIVVPTVPIPPLSALGLAQFAEFENGNYAGITFNTTYFIRSDHVGHESTHFHELIHVIQWRRLGLDSFLRAYALGLLQHGYFNSPLEVMARKHQQRFDSDESFYLVEAEVLSEVDALVQSI